MTTEYFFAARDIYYQEVFYSPSDVEAALKDYDTKNTEQYDTERAL